MAFMRHNGFAGSIPQKFIDNQLSICPMCGQEPRWELDQVIGLWASRYKFKCSTCNAILSCPVNDVVKINMDSLIIKSLTGKKALTPYLKVEEVGSYQTTEIHKGKEYELLQLKEMANEIAG